MLLLLFYIVEPFVSRLPLAFTGCVGSCLSRGSGCSILFFAALPESLARPFGCSVMKYSRIQMISRLHSILKTDKFNYWLRLYDCRTLVWFRRHNSGSASICRLACQKDKQDTSKRQAGYSEIKVL